MITDRWYDSDKDHAVLEMSLSTDEYHKDTDVSFFESPKAVCKVYEKDGQPVLFLRGTKAVRVDIQFVDNQNHRDNREVMVTQFDAFVEQCRKAGFTEIIFNTNNRLLELFCEKRLGFTKSEGEMRRFI